MKILIITENVGGTAPGRVFERIIQGLSSKHEIDVLTSNQITSIDLKNLNNFYHIKKIKLHPYIYKPLIAIIGINPFDVFYSHKCIKYLEARKNSNYNIIISFFSNHHYTSIITGYKYSKLINCKYAAYSVDAVPAPGWPENKAYYKSVKKLVMKYLSSVDIFFSSNNQMLKYQLSTFTNKNNLITDVIYNPNIGSIKNFPKTDFSAYNFVYTGKLYGVRNAKYILDAFENLLLKYPNSKLIFVEAEISKSLLDFLRNETLNKIEFHPHTDNLDYFYSKATALIDIDADIENDVFLSSKMTNYILVNRIIISETGKNSPSRRLFKGIDSIIQCDHDSEQLLFAMEKSILMNYNMKFHDREAILRLFSLEAVIDKINESLRKIL